MASKETKERILDAAELLFAENGFASTSLRAITTQAGVNLAAVNFHFGSKYDLLFATLERRIQPISRKQLEGLRMAEDVFGDGPVYLETVLRALIMPVFRMQEELGQTGDLFSTLAGQAHRAADKRIRAAFHDLVDEVIQSYFGCNFLSTSFKTPFSIFCSETRKNPTDLIYYNFANVIYVVPPPETSAFHFDTFVS